MQSKKLTARETYKKWYQNNKSQKLERRKKPGNKRIYVCICPMCGDKHKRSMRWIGRGEHPRVNCPICKNKPYTPNVEDVEGYGSEIPDNK